LVEKKLVLVALVRSVFPVSVVEAMDAEPVALRILMVVVPYRLTELVATKVATLTGPRKLEVPDAMSVEKLPDPPEVTVVSTHAEWTASYTKRPPVVEL